VRLMAACHLSELHSPPRRRLFKPSEAVQLAGAVLCLQFFQFCNQSWVGRGGAVDVKFVRVSIPAHLRVSLWGHNSQRSNGPEDGSGAPIRCRGEQDADNKRLRQGEKCRVLHWLSFSRL
jgi:hypothetical protein